MITTLTEHELCDYTSRQLNNFYPDNHIINLNDYSDAVNLALQRLEFCFKHCTLKHYNDGTQTHFNHLFSDHYVMYLYYLANSMWQLHQDKKICNKLYYLNKTLHGLDCMFDTKLPDIFLIFHGVGTMLGKAEYNDFFVVLHGCTVGSHKGKSPVIGKGVAMAANSSVIGDCKIGDYSNIGTGVLIFNKDLKKSETAYVDTKSGCIEIQASKSSFSKSFFCV
jgi:serine O-acetyltransferase